MSQMPGPGLQGDYNVVSGQGQGGPQDAPHTMLHADANEKLPAFMRTNTRWNYALEYIDFWRAEKKTMILFVFFLIAAFVTLPYFAPGGFLMFALAARLKSLAYWNKFVYRTFGKNRTLVMVD